MPQRRTRFAGACLSLLLGLSAAGLTQHPQPDPANIEHETLRHFQALLRFDTSNPGNEKLVVDYLKGVLEQAGIETRVYARDPQRPNLVARLRGNGKKRPGAAHGPHRCRHGRSVQVEASAVFGNA
jgi:hypothetical protein